MMKTKVYVADISFLNDESNFENFLKFVPVYRREKALRFKFQKGRAQSLGVGLLLKIACKEFGIPDADENVAYGENEKPYFVNSPQVHFNLSHSEERAMCVMSSCEVGCDVEKVKRDRGKLAERFFMPHEVAWIKSFALPEEETLAFYRLWTLKECYMKVTGQGLSLSPELFSFSFGENGKISLVHGCARPEFTFREFNLGDSFRYACCIKNLADTDIVEFENCNLAKRF